MKRLAALLVLAVCLVLPLTGTRANSSTPLRIGFVEWAGARNVPGIARDLYEGFVRSVRTLGLDGEVREVGPREQLIDEVGFFVRRKFDLVVVAAIVPDIGQLLDPIVARYPHTRFLLPDAAPSELPGWWSNVHAYGFRIEEASYLAGYLAALVEDERPGRHVVSSVGGVPEPQVDRFIAGYQAGARAADPRITTVNTYSGNFTVPRKCRAVALTQVAQGSGVVFDVAGTCGSGALQVAREKHVWGIGVDVDQSSLGPHILTSVLKDSGRALDLELTAFARGQLTRGGFTWFGLRDGAVRLGRVSPLVPPSALRQLAAARARVVAGTVRVPSQLDR